MKWQLYKFAQGKAQALQRRAFAWTLLTAALVALVEVVPHVDEMFASAIGAGGEDLEQVALRRKALAFCSSVISSPGFVIPAG